MTTSRGDSVLNGSNYMTPQSTQFPLSGRNTRISQNELQDLK